MGYAGMMTRSGGGAWVCTPCSGTIGANTILGDERWAGAYGVEADFWAYDNCKVVPALALVTKATAHTLGLKSTSHQWV